MSIFQLISSVFYLLIGLFTHYESELLELFFVENGLCGWIIAVHGIRVFVGLSWALALLSLFHFRFSYLLYWLYLLLSIFGLAILAKSSIVSCISNESFLTYYSPYFHYFYGLSCLAGILISVYKLKTVHSKPLIHHRYMAFLGLLFFPLAFGLSYFFNPKPIFVIPESKKTSFTLPFDSLRSNLGQGFVLKTKNEKSLLIFMSYKCQYCRSLCKKIRLIAKRNPSIPITLIVAGKPENRISFFKETGLSNLPYFVLKNEPLFWKCSLGRIPASYFIEKQKVIFRSEPADLNEPLVLDFFNS